MIKKPEVHEGDIHIASSHNMRYYSITKITGSLSIADGVNTAMPFLETVGHTVSVGQKCKVRLVSLQKVAIGGIIVREDSVLSVPDLQHVGGEFLNKGERITLPRGCQVKLGYKGNIRRFEDSTMVDYKKLNLITENSAGIF